MIANLNINSLPNKFEEVKEWLGCRAIDILSIQETKIDRTFPNSQFHIDGYKLFRRDRAKGGGGILIYINDNIIATKETTSCKSLEAILLDMQIGKRHFVLISAYKPPNVDNNTLNTDLCKVLDQAFNLSENVICMGDLNCDIMHPLHNNKQEKCLLDICYIYDLDSIINKPTRISKSISTCLDVILTNVPAFINSSDVLETGDSSNL